MKDPEVSPVYGSFEGFPPSLLVSGTKDLLMSSTVESHIMMRKAGVEADLLIYEGSSHAENMHSIQTEDSKHLYRELNAFVKSHSRSVMDNYYDLYVYGYPLVLMDVMWKTTNSPLNTVFHASMLNSDTFLGNNPDLETFGVWVDLEKGPVVIEIPAIDRYHTFQLLDSFTNVLVSYGYDKDEIRPSGVVIVHSEWRGSIPKQKMHLVNSSTKRLLFLLNVRSRHTSVKKTEMQNIEDELHVQLAYPSKKKKKETRKALLKETPRHYIREMSSETFFNSFLSLLADIDHSSIEASIIAILNRTNMAIGEKWSPSSHLQLSILPKEIHRVWRDDFTLPDSPFMEKGWLLLSQNAGEYGTEYARRAFIAHTALGVENSETLYTIAKSFDSENAPLHGSQKYELRFSAPPKVENFWSLTIFSREEEDVITRSFKPVSDWKHTNDNWYVLYLQKEELNSHWMPTPEGPFDIVLRLYGRLGEVLTDGHVFPEVVRVY